MTAKREITKIVDIWSFEIPEQVPIEFNQDVAPEDDLLENSDFDAYPSQVSEPWELCTFNPKFPELERLKSVVKSHGSVLFQPFDKEGLRVSPLKLKVHPSASFRMQPCRFIRDGILKPLKTMLDQFVCESVLISNSSYDFASPLVIVNKRDDGIRMAVDYREANMQLEATANQTQRNHYNGY